MPKQTDSDDLIHSLKDGIKESENNGDGFESTSWNMQWGVLLSRKEAVALLQALQSSSAQETSEQKILDTLRFVGRHFRRQNEELSKPMDALIQGRLLRRSEEALKQVDEALTVFHDPTLTDKTE